MSESTIDYTLPPILVRMGLCLDKTCQGYKNYGPVGCRCHGNFKYSSRKSHDEFMPFHTIKEQLRSNHVDFSNYIGICEGVACFEIGYPGMMCMECCNSGDEHYFIPARVQAHTPVFVRLYSGVSEKIKSTELRRVIVPDIFDDTSISLHDSSI